MDEYKAIEGLKKWFRLENYTDIATFSDKQIHEQISFRDIVISDAERLESKFDLAQDNIYENCFESPDYHRWRAVIQGGPIIDFSHEYRTPEQIKDDEKSERELRAIQDELAQDKQKYLDDNPAEKAYWLEFQRVTDHFNGLRVSGSNLVKAMDVKALKVIYEDFAEDGLIGEQHLLNGLDSKLFFADINMTMKSYGIDRYSHGYNDFYSSLDLANATDTEILEQMKILLPMWRKELDIPEPAKRAVTPSLFKKAASYRIIPYLDIKIWSALFGIKFTHQQYADILFPDNENRATADFIKQTVIPHTQKILAILDRELDIEVLPFRESRKK